jgi:hypothetical protein
MPNKSIAQKLMIKAGQSVYFVNPPRGYPAAIGNLPKGTTLVKTPAAPIDFIQVFVANRTELEIHLPTLKTLLGPNSMLWVTYHKGTSPVKTDINRDTINAYAHTLGLEGVAMISIDDDWSALRLKVS